MAMTITIELSDLEEKCMKYVAMDPAEWATNAVKARIFRAKEEIYAREVARMMQDPNVASIPADKDAIVAAADVPALADLQAAADAELAAQMPTPPEAT